MADLIGGDDFDAKVEAWNAHLAGKVKDQGYIVVEAAELTRLRARVAELEGENAELRRKIAILDPDAPYPVNLAAGEPVDALKAAVQAKGSTALGGSDGRA